MKTASKSSVAVSLGSRRWNRMTPSGAARAPAMRVRPSTRKALASSDPTMEAWATTVSPARSAKMTTKSSGRFPSVDCSTPVSAGPVRSPSASVANDTCQASPASATVASAKVAMPGAPP